MDFLMQAGEDWLCEEVWSWRKASALYLQGTNLDNHKLKCTHIYTYTIVVGELCSSSGLCGILLMKLFSVFYVDCMTKISARGRSDFILLLLRPSVYTRYEFILLMKIN